MDKWEQLDSDLNFTFSQQGLSVCYTFKWSGTADISRVEIRREDAKTGETLAAVIEPVKKRSSERFFSLPHSEIEALTLVAVDAGGMQKLVRRIPLSKIQRQSRQKPAELRYAVSAFEGQAGISVVSILCDTPLGQDDVLIRTARMECMLPSALKAGRVCEYLIMEAASGIEVGVSGGSGVEVQRETRSSLGRSLN